jgi:hypothetical protein
LNLAGHAEKVMPTRDLIYGAEMPRPQPARRLWHSGPEFATQRTLGDCCDRGGFRQVLSSAIRQTGENSGTPKGAAQFWFRRPPLHSCGGGFGWGAACRNGAGPAPSFRRLAGLPAQAGKGASGRGPRRAGGRTGASRVVLVPSGPSTLAEASLACRPLVHAA